MPQSRRQEGNPAPIDATIGSLENQLFNGGDGPAWPRTQAHSSVSKRAPAFYAITPLACAYQILPTSLTTEAPRHYVVDGQLDLRSPTVLTGMPVAGEYFAPGQLHGRHWAPDVIAEPYHRGSNKRST